MNIQEKINVLMENPAFKAAFENAASPLEVVELFGANGVEVPMAIAQELFQPLASDEELNEAALENVAGGGKLASIIGGALGNGIYYGAGYLGGRLAGWDKKRSREYAKSCGKFGTTFGTLIGYVLPTP